MRNIFGNDVLLVLAMVFGTGCAVSTTAPAPAADSCGQVYESAAIGHDIPVCSWFLGEFGCDTFVDYNHDGVTNIHDLEDFCYCERNGDFLTRDVELVAGHADFSQPCYTCD